MGNILDRKVLQLNAAWLPIGTTTVKSALEDMNSSRHPKSAIKIEFPVDIHGLPDYAAGPTEVIPLRWAEWITLSPRVYDEDYIRTVHLDIRIPTVVIVGSKYNKLPVKTYRPTKLNIYNRYQGICAYTGRKLSYRELTLDHITPRSKGGGNTWSNLVPCDGETNRKKADKTLEESGLKLKYKPSEPAPVTAQMLIKDTNPDWSLFLSHTKQ
jgi:5-methylcytosine-specific restriction endonuclease McrA